MSKLVSAPSFRLKGGGWYETDFKTTGKKHLADSAEPTGKDSNPVSSGDKKTNGDKSASTVKTAENKTADKKSVAASAEKSS